MYFISLRYESIQRKTKQNRLFYSVLYLSHNLLFRIYCDKSAGIYHLLRQILTGFTASTVLRKAVSRFRSHRMVCICYSSPCSNSKYHSLHCPALPARRKQNKQLWPTNTINSHYLPPFMYCFHCHPEHSLALHLFFGEVRLLIKKAPVMVLFHFVAKKR